MQPYKFIYSCDKMAFESIARKYTDMLYAHALVILGNKADAEDAAEEAIYKLLVRKLPFRDDEHVKAWLTIPVE